MKRKFIASLAIIFALLYFLTLGLFAFLIIVGALIVFVALKRFKGG